MNPSSRCPTLLDLLPEAVAAVQAAGAMIRSEFHRPGGPLGQGGTAPVDKEVEEMLKRRLLALYPCGWRGEETPAVASSGGACWVVDPNDGTSAFLKRIRGTAISVALLVDGKPALGIVHAPTAPDDGGDLIAWAEGGMLSRNGQPVDRSSAGVPPVIAMNADAADYALHNYLALPGLRIRALPSPAYRLALAAVSEVDAALSLTGGLSPWDIAGGHALLLGAGKLLVDRSGNVIDYSLSRSFDGCIGGRHEIVQALVEARPGHGQRKPRHGVRPSQPVSDRQRLSRAQGCLLGQLAGDALGSAVEFESAPTIARRHPGGIRTLEDGGTWNLIAGQPTDDGEMALALARSLIESRGFDRDAIAAAYIAWRNSSPFDIGGTTSRGIMALAAKRSRDSDSQSNGALMRVSPVGIFASGDPARAAALAREDALLTHPHPVCQASSAAYAAAIAAGIAGGNAQAMWQAACDHAGEDSGAEAVRARLNEARSGTPSSYQDHMGWVLTAIHNAFHWLTAGASLEEAVIATVAQGGDTDTNAAVCGALLGALHGRDAVPLQWRNAVLTCRPVAARGVHHPRPRDYWPDDALDLAEALLTAAP